MMITTTNHPILLVSLTFLCCFALLLPVTTSQCVLYVSSEGNCPANQLCTASIQEAVTKGLELVNNETCSKGDLFIYLPDEEYLGGENCNLIFKNVTKKLTSFNLISMSSGSGSGSGNGELETESGSGSGSGGSGTTTTFNCSGHGQHLKFWQPTYEIVLFGINFVDGESSGNGGSLIIEGSTAPIYMTNCRFYNNQGVNGGAVCLNVQDSVYINNVVFADNKAKGNGGGLVLEIAPNISASSQVELNYTRWKGNKADGNGGGLFATGPQFLTTYLYNFTANGNQAKSSGGGACISSSFSLSEVSIRTNVAKEGGGVAVSSTWGNIAGGLIHNNTVTDRGGGVYLDSTNLELKSLNIFGNAAKEGGGVYIYQSSVWRSKPQNVDNSIFKYVEINNNYAEHYGGGAFVNDSISEWEGVLFFGNQGKSQEGSFAIKDPNVYCTPLAVSNYCTRCSCRDQCGSCSSQGCSYISEDSCICYVEQSLEDECNNFDLPSQEDHHHNTGLVLGLVFGLLLPLVAFAVLGSWLVVRWRRRRAYQVLDQEETSNRIHPL